MTYHSSVRILLFILFVIAFTIEPVLSDEKATKERREAPKVGDVAPNFALKSLDGKSEMELASFRGERPVVLFFGSYT